ncbi:hypothetical protein C2E23DRAFT_312330 [Lenzites betulinus]|nr:hypothetical protein C2E23DRAFT_312330 [Lenzites betulinus]
MLAYRALRTAGFPDCISRRSPSHSCHCRITVATFPDIVTRVRASPARGFGMAGDGGRSWMDRSAYSMVGDSGKVPAVMCYRLLAILDFQCNRRQAHYARTAPLAGLGLPKDAALLQASAYRANAARSFTSAQDPWTLAMFDFQSMPAVLSLRGRGSCKMADLPAPRRHSACVLYALNGPSPLRQLHMGFCSPIERWLNRVR